MTQLERDNILLDLQKRMGTMQEDVSGLKDDVSILKSDVSGLKDDVSILKSDVSGLNSRVSELEHETRSISRSVAVIEKEHSEKLQVLIDVYPEFYRKFSSFAKNFVSNDHRFDNLEARIYSLETKAANQ